jgi:hypothetical protein
MGIWSGSGGLSPFSGGGYFGGKNNLLSAGGHGFVQMASGLNQGRLPFSMGGTDSFGRGVQNWMNYIGGGAKTGNDYMGGFSEGGNEMNLGGFINPATYLDGGDGNWGR